ncbi:MAG TPA: hypothetical protein VNM90_12240, partial [Haliangium sp.]|nr:hypothetical protein [Haliangium sp.]
MAELIARASAEVAARPNGAAHEQALLELAGGRMPALAETLARAYEMSAAHGGFARLEALASTGPADTVAVDTALAGLKALGARAPAPTVSAPASAPAQALAPAAFSAPVPASAPAQAAAPAPTAAPAAVS